MRERGFYHEHRHDDWHDCNEHYASGGKPGWFRQQPGWHWKQSGWHWKFEQHNDVFERNNVLDDVWQQADDGKQSVGCEPVSAGGNFANCWHSAEHDDLTDYHYNAERNETAGMKQATGNRQ